MEGCDGNITQVLNAWVIKRDVASANKLRSIVYFHLKSVVQKQVSHRKSLVSAFDALPNTTSLVHDVLIKLAPPKELFDNRKQFYLSLASFVRWMLLDEIKSKTAKKRVLDNQVITELFLQEDNFEPYLLFDDALSKLQGLAPRAYNVAMLHYFLGCDLDDIETELQIKKSTAYNELSTAKAFLRTQCVS